ncbi:protein ZBED8-like [Homarus americanus]|uniref:protein ZBED8-like n=1 Tax=Homarus americanus TaxID=6706 RepID=UPI001C47490D|nr:protein ZBED8-like [Homarus americanus]
MKVPVSLKKKASLKITHLLVTKKKPITESEEIIVPALNILAEEVLGKSAAMKLNEVPLSATTMERWKLMIAEDLLLQLAERVRKSPCYGLQFDLSTDFTNRAQLTCFTCYVDCEHLRMIEEFLFSEDVGAETTGEATAKKVLDCLTHNGIPIEKCSHITTDGAARMVGIRNGAVARLKDYAPNCGSSHCTLHRQNLASKHLPSESDLDAAMKK